MFSCKQTRSKFYDDSEDNTQSLFDLIHCDIWVLGEFFCHVKHIVFFTIIDAASRAVWVYLMKDKGEMSHL